MMPCAKISKAAMATTRHISIFPFLVIPVAFPQHPDPHPDVHSALFAVEFDPFSSLCIQYTFLKFGFNDFTSRIL
jgi:hypothetical protein